MAQEATKQGEWKAQVLRLTAFTNKTIQIPEPSWWFNLVGEAPDQKFSKPKVGALLEEGKYQAGKLVLNMAPSRIDWFYTVADEQIALESITSLGMFGECVDQFAPVMNRWLSEMCPSIQRLAFGAVVFQPVENHQVGYTQLATYLPCVKLDPDSSDFMYQINRPRDTRTGIQGLKINRLSKWGVMKLLLHIMTPTQAMLTDPGLLGCRLEMDVNTAPDYPDDLPGARLSEIFHELVSFSKEITDKGDTP